MTAEVKKGDRIVRGEISDVSAFDPDTALTVMSAAKHDYGSEDMQHVEIGAR